MPTEVALLKLMMWLSPAFPTGGFAWSGGLEAACWEGSVTDASSLADWCRHSLAHGSARSDAIVLSITYSGEETPAEMSTLALALATSPERQAESLEQGTAFLRAARHWQMDPEPLAYPVAVGVSARQHGIALDDTLAAFLHALMSQTIQAALRLLPLGQDAAARLLSELEPDILAAARAASETTLDGLGSAAPIMDIAAMRHTTLDSRIFRS